MCNQPETMRRAPLGGEWELLGVGIRFQLCDICFSMWLVGVSEATCPRAGKPPSPCDHRRDHGPEAPGI